MFYYIVLLCVHMIKISAYKFNKNLMNPLPVGNCLKGILAQIL